MTGLMTLILALGLPVLAGSEDPIVFPDAAFKAALVARYDTNTDGEISQAEAAAVSSLYATRAGVTDITGVEFFTNLSLLDVGYNSLTVIPDLSGLTGLQFLFVNHNQLTALPDLSALTRLRWLYAHVNRLTALPDLSANTQLERLLVLVNQLETLPAMAPLTRLQWLNLEHNRLTAIPDLTGLSNLSRLTLHRNDLSEDDCDAIVVVEGLGLTEFTHSPTNSGATISCACELTPVVAPMDQSACLGVPIQLVIEMEPVATDDLLYQWFRNGTALDEAPLPNHTSITVANLSPESFGDYTCVVTGCNDQTYASPPARVSYHLDQGDSPCDLGLVVSSSSDVDLVEGLDADAFRVWLTAPPQGTVTVSMSTTDLDDLVVYPESFQVTASDWWQPRFVQVYQPDDGAAVAATVQGTVNFRLSDGSSILDTVTRDLAVDLVDVAQTSAAWIWDTVRTTAGAQLEVPLRLRLDPEDQVTSFEFVLSYDADLLTFDGIQSDGDLAEGWELREVPGPGSNDLIISGIGTPALAGEGILMRLSFTLADAPVETVAHVGIDEFLLNNSRSIDRASGGSLVIADCTLGDMSGDRQVKPLDASLALRQLVDLEHAYLRSGPSLCGDADCNGSLTGYDAGLIFQRAVGVLDELCADPFNGAVVQGVIMNGPAIRVEAGRPFALPVNITALDPAAPLKGFQFTLVFDHRRLTLSEVSLSGGLAGFMTTLDHQPRPGVLKVAGYHPDGVVGEGLFLTLHGVAGGEVGPVELRFENAGFNDGNPQLLSEPLILDIEDGVGPSRADFFAWTTMDSPAQPAWAKVDGVLAGDDYLIQILSPPPNGSLTPSGSRLTYMPDAGFIGRDLFTFRAIDPLDRSVDGVGVLMVFPPAYQDLMTRWRGGTMTDLAALVNQTVRVAKGGRP